MNQATVTLSKNSIKKNHYIHLIVVEHFLEQKRDGFQVNHKNKVRDDNRLVNLELVTCSYNMKHSYKTLDTNLLEKSNVNLS